LEERIDIVSDVVKVKDLAIPGSCRGLNKVRLHASKTVTVSESAVQ